MANTYPTDSSLYRIPSSLIGKGRRHPIPAIIDLSEQYICKPDEKTEFLAGSLECQFALNSLDDPGAAQEHEDEIEETRGWSINFEPEITSAEEVAERLTAFPAR